jgi:hypothetical protein
MTYDARTRLDCPDHRDHGRRSLPFFSSTLPANCSSPAAAEQQAEVVAGRVNKVGWEVRVMSQEGPKTSIASRLSHREP